MTYFKFDIFPEYKIMQNSHFEFYTTTQLVIIRYNLTADFYAFMRNFKVQKSIECVQYIDKIFRTTVQVITFDNYILYRPLYFHFFLIIFIKMPMCINTHSPDTRI